MQLAANEALNLNELTLSCVNTKGRASIRSPFSFYSSFSLFKYFNSAGFDHSVDFVQRLAASETSLVHSCFDSFPLID